MVTPLSPDQTLPAAKPDWLMRNWKWVVPAGIVLLLLVVVGFVGTVLLIVETSFQHSGCYVQALSRTRSNPQVIAKVGQPIVAGWFASGSINVSGPSGNADISIPISGPKGKGTIYVVAKKVAGEWRFETLQVEVNEQNERVDLLKPEGDSK